MAPTPWRQDRQGRAAKAAKTLVLGQFLGSEAIFKETTPCKVDFVLAGGVLVIGFYSA
jgi:hypothetical protein